MADKLSDAISPEGQVPDTGDSVGIMDSISFGKAVAILSFGAFGGLAVARWAFNQTKSVTGQDLANAPVVGDL